jgi:hypothetical protein
VFDPSGYREQAGALLAVISLRGTSKESLIGDRLLAVLQALMYSKLEIWSGMRDKYYCI